MEEDSLKRRTELTRPDVSADEAKTILLEHYGLSGELTELGSQQDRNYRIDTAEGRFVLKIARAEYERVELEAQNAALRHVSAKADAPTVPQVVPALDGEEIVSAAMRDGTYQFRLLTYLEGTPLTRRKHLAAETVSALGDLAGRLAVALADFDHPGLDRQLQWDLRRAGPVALQLLSAMADVDMRKRIAEAMVGAMRRVQPLMPELRLQAIHQDVTDDNVVSRAETSGRLVPEGVIDFGDVLKGWLVADLAVTCASLLHHA
ncbi:Ser/Thr protein kinase RdoA (MazF antagonist) [Sinorhizobium fredii]